MTMFDELRTKYAEDKGATKTYSMKVWQKIQKIGESVRHHEGIGTFGGSKVSGAIRQPPQYMAQTDDLAHNHRMPLPCWPMS
jgi:hypothetical protein